MEALGGVNVFAERDDHQGKIVFGAEVDADALAGLVGQGTNINVSLQLVARDQFGAQITEFRGREGKLDADDAGIMAKSFVVLERAKKEKLILLRDPITANTLKNAGAVMKGVGQNAHLGVPKLVKTSFKVNQQIKING